MSESTAGDTRESAPMRLLGCGRDTDVYDIGDGKVLRRYRVDYDHSPEIGAMKHLHEHGFPVPQLFSADGPDMVVERVDGPTMLDALVRYPWRARRYGRMLADLHRRLHAIAPAAELRTAGTPREAVLHLDLHPGNVLLAPHGPVVIDWSTASAGPAGADVARTIVIMTIGEADVPWLLRVGITAVRRTFVHAFRAAAHVDPAPYLVEACRVRLNDPNAKPVELQRLRAMLAKLERA
jgi:aminoglycoside phosphotransferase (APT) family kinase protein